MRDFDFRTTPLGSVESWPTSLCSAVSMCLASPLPLVLFWGESLTLLYNDAFSALLGKRHPSALGIAGKALWPEVWHTLGPLIEAVFERGEARTCEDQPLPLERYGYAEECYFSFALSAIRDERGVAAVLGIVNETTARVIGERRVRVLRALSERAASATSPENACRASAEVLATATDDLPFSMVYLANEAGDGLQLSSTLGGVPAPVTLELRSELAEAWGLAAALAGQTAVILDAPRRFGAPVHDAGERPHMALVLPIARAGARAPYGALVAGVSPRRPLDDAYRNFLELTANHLAMAITNAHDTTGAVLALRESERARRRAEDENRAKDEFLAMLGHELRNPLAPIATALELLRLHARVEGRPVPHEHSIIERQAQHLSRLVDDLLDVARIAQGRITLRKKPVELAKLVALGLEIAGPALEGRKHEVLVDVPEHGLVVDADELRMSQVVANLLINAAAYTPVGGDVRVTGVREGSEVVLRVRDNGVGIEPDLHEQVFVRFTQGRRAARPSGLGLGLTLVRSFVAMHGGSVVVQSEGHDRGSELIVRLPRLAMSTSHGATSIVPSIVPRPVFVSKEAMTHDPSVTHSASGAARTKRRRILVVDDNPDAAEVLADWLELTGNTAKSAHQAREALDLAASFRPEVALLDLGLPVMDGFELAERLRKVPGCEGTRLIAVTGHGLPDDHQQTRAAGFDEHMVKPIDFERLGEVIGRLCDASDHEDEKG